MLAGFVGSSIRQTTVHQELQPMEFLTATMPRAIRAIQPMTEMVIVMVPTSMILMVGGSAIIGTGTMQEV